MERGMMGTKRLLTVNARIWSVPTRFLLEPSAIRGTGVVVGSNVKYVNFVHW